MIALSISIFLSVVIVALLAAFLTNKWLDQEYNLRLRSDTVNMDVIGTNLHQIKAEMEKRHETLRIGHAEMRSEMDSLKMQLAMRRAT